MRDLANAPGAAGSTPRAAAREETALERERSEPAAHHAAVPASHLLLLVFLLLLMANVALLVPGVAALAPAQTAGIAAVALLLVETTFGRRPLRLAAPESYLLLAFLGISALSCFTALWMRHAVENTQLLAKFVAIAIVIVNTVDSPRRLRQTMLVLAAGGLFPALGALHDFRRGLAVDGRAGWIGIFANPNELAGDLVTLLPVLLAVAFTSGPWLRRLLFLGSVAYLGAIYLTYSRGGLLALALVLAMCVWRWGGTFARVVGVIGGIAGSLCLPLFWQRKEGFSALGSDVTVQQRLTTVEVGLEMFMDHPFVGVGPGCSVIGFPLYAPADMARKGWLMTHNTFVQVLAETGLGGFAVLAGAVAIALTSTRRHARLWRARGHPDVALLVSSLEIAMWGFLACSLAGGLLFTWFPYLVLALAAAARLMPVPLPAPAPSRGLSRRAPDGRPRSGRPDPRSRPRSARGRPSRRA